MDRLAYIAMTGAQQLLEQQAVTAHNLANLSTTGYKAETSAFRVAPLDGPGQPTRAYPMDTTQGADLSAGSMQPTGRDLDVAVQGEGFLTVQARDGAEAYTRDGNFSISPDGELTTHNGLQVLGEGGPINIPPDSKVSIGQDGTVSVTTFGQPAANVTVVGRLKLVKPERGEITKGPDGLFRLNNGGTAEPNPAVSVLSGTLEGSNVNAVSAMVDMINLARQFEMHMKLLQQTDNNEQRATQLLSSTPG